MKNMMTKKQASRKNSFVADISGWKTGLFLDLLPFYGVSGIAGDNPKSAAKSQITSLKRSPCNTLVGLSNLSFTVRIMVVNMETFFMPFLERVPKVGFLKITLFLREISTQLFVGLRSSGKLRSVKIFVLFFFSLLRRVSLSLCVSDFPYSFLKNLRICFFRPLQISGCKMENCP